MLEAREPKFFTPQEWGVFLERKRRILQIFWLTYSSGIYTQDISVSAVLHFYLNQKVLFLAIAVRY